MKKNAEVWWNLAQEDLEVSSELLLLGRFANVVIFHAQQAVEKAFKACLEEEGLDIPKIHSCRRLHALLSAEGVVLASEEDVLDQIDEVYIDARYPNNLGELPKGQPEQSDAQKFYSIAVDILRTVGEYLKEGKVLIR